MTINRAITENNKKVIFLWPLRGHRELSPQPTQMWVTLLLQSAGRPKPTSQSVLQMPTLLVAQVGLQSDGGNRGYMENNNLDTHLNGSSTDKDSLFDTDDEEEEKEYQDFKQFLDEIFGEYK